MNGYLQKTSAIKLVLVGSSLAALLASGNASAQTALPGSDLILPATASPTADMVNLKTQNAGRSDSFSVTVTNTGSVQVIGALVTDTGGNGGYCAKSNAVIITGNGVPEGTFTIANLSGAGIALGALQPGQSATLNYSCQGK